MTNWEKFELDCTEYLKRRYGMYAEFIHQGGSDSTIPDILVQTNSGRSFYIDVKLCPAQCGQFVLLPNIETSTFEYSRQNVNRINSYASMIMDYMNASFNEYREAGTTGKIIDMPNSNEVFSGWIMETYASKGTKYFITNDYEIFTIDQLKNHFDITASYRIKRSGSSSVGRSRIKTVSDYIINHDYYIDKTRVEGDKLFASSPKDLHNQRFILRAHEYMFSLRDLEYEIRKLSNTYNANVIFSINKKGIESGITDSEFISDLQQ